MYRIFTLFLWLLCLSSAAGMAGTITDLYQAEAPVANLRPENRRPAIRAALGMVLVKLTGDRYAAADPSLQQVLQRAESYMLEFKTNAESLMLWVHFDENTLTRDLRELGVALWGKERPSTLLWLLINDQSGSQILGLEGNPEYLASTGKRARLRGIDLTYPLLDLEDAERLPPGLILQGNTQAILDASDRYPVESILAGIVEAVAPELWEGRWYGYLDGAVHNWRSEGDMSDIAIGEGIDHMADLLAARFIQENAQEQSSISLTITDINTVAQYAAALKYLESLSVVSKVQVSSVTPGEVTFRLLAHGGCNAVAQAIELGRKLIPGDARPCTRYQLLP
jgi:hypothetical protein